MPTTRTLELLKTNGNGLRRLAFVCGLVMIIGAAPLRAAHNAHFVEGHGSGGVHKPITHPHAL